jgi:ABC-type sugar transport system ATPase subunit
MTEPRDNTLLRVSCLQKKFGQATALSSVSFEIYEKEVLGVIGQNGSGKSTLLRIIGGVLRPNSGQLVVHGVPIRFAHPRDALNVGIAMMPQDFGLCPNLTVAENVFLGRELCFRFLGCRIERRARMIGETKRILETVGASDIQPTAVAGTLSGGQQRTIALAKLVLSNARLLLLDEPASGLSMSRRDKVIEFVRHRRDAGSSVVYVSHSINEILHVADRIVILRAGTVLKVMSRDTVDSSALTELMLG